MNQGTMVQYEHQVADYLRQTKNHVCYCVTFFQRNRVTLSWGANGSVERGRYHDQLQCIYLQCIYLQCGRWLYVGLRYWKSRELRFVL